MLRDWKRPCLGEYLYGLPKLLLPGHMVGADIFFAANPAHALGANVDLHDAAVPAEHQVVAALEHHGPLGQLLAENALETWRHCAQLG